MSPVVVGIHRPAAVSGVSSSGVRLAALSAPYTPWIPLVVGAAASPEELLEHSPLRHSTGVRACCWSPGAGIAEQVLAVRDALTEMGAQIVVPNDLAHGFAAAALRPEIAIAAWYHADHYDGDELLIRCGELADAWRAVSDRGVRRITGRAREWGLAVRGVGAVMPACADVPDRACPPRVGDAGLTLLYAGRLEKQTKRVLDLVPLVAALKASGVRTHLVVAGTGPADAQLRAAADASGVGACFDFRGAVPLGEMPKLISACDALVLVSESEGMPTVVMEAMAAGRPVAITTGCGMAASIVRHGFDGFVVPTGDMLRLAASLAQAHQRSDLSTMGAAAHATAAARFSPAAMGPFYEGFIRESIAGVAQRPGPRQRWRSILPAIEGLGAVTSADVEQLAREYETATGLPSGTVARELPRRPGPAARLMRAAIDRLIRGGAARIGLYGAGRHTSKVESEIAGSPAVVCFIDDRAGQPGVAVRLLGRPVLTPREAVEAGLDAVIINSDEHEREMLPRAREWAGSALVTGLYESPPAPQSSPWSCAA